MHNELSCLLKENIINELSNGFIKNVLKNAFEKEKAQLANNDMVGAVKTAKQFVAIHSKQRIKSAHK